MFLLPTSSLQHSALTTPAAARTFASRQVKLRSGQTVQPTPSLATPRSCLDTRLRAAQSVGTPLDTSVGSPAWQAFAERVTGEWDGVSATFNAAGEAQELPPYYVPDAYREWGVTLYDWQQQTTSLASPDGLSINVRKLFPTVGCEADAVAFEEEARRGLATDPAQEGECKTILPDGSYSIGPRVLAANDNGSGSARIETCLYGPPSAPQQERVRVVHTLVRREGRWGLQTVEVAREKFDRPYDGRRELGGCGGGGAAFATKPRTSWADLEAGWATQAGAAFEVDSAGAFRMAGEAPAGGASCWSAAAEGDGGLMLLPLGTWSYVGGQGDDLVVEAGWLAAAGWRRVGGRRFAATRLTHVWLGTDAKVA